MKYPITPEYLRAVGDGLIPLYQDLEDYIIAKICEQFKTGEANATALELIRELQRRGLRLDEIERRIRETLNISQVQLDNIFSNAIRQNQQFYSAVFDKSELVRAEEALDVMRQEAAQIARQTANTFENLTQSLGFAVRSNRGIIEYQPFAQAYQTILDRAAIRVLSGTDSYDVAIGQAVKDLTDSGIQTIDYATGRHDRVDVAVRRAVMTGITQLSARNSDIAAEELDTPYVEVTAHTGARDTGMAWQDHKSWQGRVYSRNAGDIYPSVYAVCGLGMVDGLCGVNCRHMYYPWFEGISERTYTDEELANIDPPPFEFEGKQYTRYEATQYQRKMERAMRSVKRRAIGDKAAGREEAYTADSVKYRRLNEEYDRFCKASGLPPQKQRGNIREFGPKEGRALTRRGKQQSDSVAAFESRMTAAGYSTEGFDR